MVVVERAAPSVDCRVRASLVHVPTSIGQLGHFECVTTPIEFTLNVVDDGLTICVCQ
jgi:hypothetical protein